MNFWQHQDDARRRTRRLLLAFALAVLALAAAVHGALVLAWLGVGWLLHLRLPFPLGFAQVNVGVTLLLVLGGWLLEISNLRAGGVRLAERIGAREARPAVSHAEQRLCNIIDELAIAAHMPRPQAMVLPRADAINAFAAGWEPADAVVAVTQGALDYLTREELQGMVAHELSHLYEGDTYLKMQLAGMVQGLELVHGFGDHLRGYGALGAFFGSLVMVVGFAGWLAGRVFKAAVSRQREYLADARAVQWTRSKNGLGGVLRKVLAQWEAGQVGQAASVSHERVAPIGLAHPVVQHMLLVELPSRHLLAHWLDSHPPLAERVRRIYGRSMPPLPVAPVYEAPDSQRRPATMPEPGAQTLASKVDPFARY
jgi:Zn-dependent protease with chaperone function